MTMSWGGWDTGLPFPHDHRPDQLEVVMHWPTAQSARHGRPGKAGKRLGVSRNGNGNADAVNI